MALSTAIKERLNHLLAVANVRVETLTAEKAELRRLHELEQKQHFSHPAYPVLPLFQNIDVTTLLKCLTEYSQRLSTFADGSQNDVRYTFANEYYTSPDAEILYAITRLYKPARIIEVGSGNSTKLFRQAIIDGNLETRLISIDPEPRTNITGFADEIWSQRVELLEDLQVFSTLHSGDILFIDSSHEVKAGNDVLFLFLHVLPTLSPGVVVHIHDIFLPYEYPIEWIRDLHLNWSEQYLVQVMLTNGDHWDVWWPGHYLQRTLPDFDRHFPNRQGGHAQSLWITKKEQKPFSE
jgi:predicted O-methyltransferase YrrM